MAAGIATLKGRCPVKAEALIREIPDFPIPGIVFRDIAPVLLDPAAMREVCSAFTALARDLQVDLVVGIESRGFLFGVPAALEAGLGFVPVRKSGKLPGKTVRSDYALEYGVNSVEIQVDAVIPGQRCLIVDDVIATGGTAMAACEVVERVGGIVVAAAFLIELKELKGRDRLTPRTVVSFLSY